MKLTRNTKRAKGMTLLELTVVILVLLSLISILFVGARAWKKGSDRSSNILNIRNVQQAVRGHANMNGIPYNSAADTIPQATIFPTYMAVPTSPTATAYGFGNNNPDIGVLYVTNPTVGGATADEYFYAGAAADFFGGKVAEW